LVAVFGHRFGEFLAKLWRFSHPISSTHTHTTLLGSRTTTRTPSPATATAVSESVHPVCPVCARLLSFITSNNDRSIDRWRQAGRNLAESERVSEPNRSSNLSDRKKHTHTHSHTRRNHTLRITERERHNKVRGNERHNHCLSVQGTTMREREKHKVVVVQSTQREAHSAKGTVRGTQCEKHRMRSTQ